MRYGNWSDEQACRHMELAYRYPMIGIPSGWERIAAWCWLDPDTYPQAIAGLNKDIKSGELIGAYVADDFADFIEMPW